MTVIIPDRAPPSKAPVNRREWLLLRLAEADGPAYDLLCGAVVEAFPEDSSWLAAARGVRALRKLLWEGFATTEPDESVWLTSRGWQRAGEVPRG
jgi:hypothetical protein